jgi:hypothetical protein
MRCPFCKSIGEAIAAEARIPLLDLDGNEALTLLRRARPEGWKRLPHLIQVRQPDVSAWTRGPALVRLIGLLGIFGALRLCVRHPRQVLRIVTPRWR